MRRFEKIIKIDDKEVTFITSYNNMDVYRNTDDSSTLWLVHNEQVIFSFYEYCGELFVAEEYREL